MQSNNSQNFETTYTSDSPTIVGTTSAQTHAPKSGRFMPLILISGIVLLLVGIVIGFVTSQFYSRAVISEKGNLEENSNSVAITPNTNEALEASASAQVSTAQWIPVQSNAAPITFTMPSDWIFFESSLDSEEGVELIISNEQYIPLTNLSEVAKEDPSVLTRHISIKIQDETKKYSDSLNRCVASSARACYSVIIADAVNECYNPNGLGCLPSVPGFSEFMIPYSDFERVENASFSLIEVTPYGNIGVSDDEYLYKKFFMMTNDKKLYSVQALSPNVKSDGQNDFENTFVFKILESMEFKE